MTDEEIIDFIKKSDENTQQIKISAAIASLIDILIRNKITTLEEYNILQEKYLEHVRVEQVRRMTPEERQQIEAASKFSELFGNLGNL